MLDQDAGNVYAHYNLGVIAEAAGDTATAATEYDNALATDPAFAPALFNRGVLPRGRRTAGPGDGRRRGAGLRLTRRH